MWKEHPLITIIVPVYNTEQYVYECIDSIVRQTYKNLQIIIIDDGSTDNSLEICQKFASQDSRIQVFHQSHKGVSNARNLGLNHAAGEFIAFIDSDDTVLPSYLENMYETIAVSDAALVKTLYMVNGRISGNLEIMKFEGTKLLNIKELPSCSMLSAIAGTMHRSSDIGELRFDPEIQYGEDTNFNTKVLYYSKSQNAVFLPKAEYIYRMREDSAIHTADYRIYKTHLIGLQQMLLMCNGLAAEKNLKCSIERYWVVLFMKMINSDVKADQKELRDVRKKAIEARKKGCKPDSLKSNIVEILYLYHCRWIVACYCAVKKILRNMLSPGNN